ncbi:hypothetical protein [Pseudoduganella aquatica]|uniref:DUF2975 domain-containing protein n=1 Tax=Pseudoduganella aquatica TaxID=2660641 RepID=A0A7X4KN99_9BURK|nr:hypothetical protein [Pseudoduganella aquatica]MYN08952.1 hypothetical protein [Pseudoduganella aquatica]
MDLQRHDRIGKIKQWSRNLGRLLTLIGYLLWLGWPASLLFFYGSGTFILFGTKLERTQLSLPSQCALVLFFWCALALSQLLVFHIRKLMAHFSAGDVFNQGALDAAGKALRYGIALFVVEIAMRAGVTLYVMTSGGSYSLSFPFDELISGMLFFGVMYVLLWTLEIGRDLNQESSLTI